MALPEGTDAILKLLEESLPFAGIPSFMKRDHTKEIREGDAVVMGVPFDSGTFNRPGTRYGPRAIREQSSYAAAFDPVYPWNRKLADARRIVDFGDVASLPATGVTESMLQATEAVAAEIFKAGAFLLTLGGDHTIPYGPVRAAAKRFGKLALIPYGQETQFGETPMGPDS